MGSQLIELDEARAIVLAHCGVLEEETTALAQALGRVLASDVRCEAPVPSFDSSAMDGFAVRVEDLGATGDAASVRLLLAGESRAGHPHTGALPGGAAVAISTGALLPKGADAVVPVEDARSDNGHVQVPRGVLPGANVRRAGDDLRAGETVLRAGRALAAAELGVLASLGRDRVSCVRRARVGVITTGDELVEPGAPLRPGQIYNTNAYSVPALLAQAGAQLELLDSAADEQRATVEAIARALERCDVIVICGGVSVGEHDHVKHALRELGVREEFWGIALKPGKPTWFGTSESKLVFGLPGNPVSAIVTFTLLAAPALRALGGRTEVRREASACLARDYAKPAGRAHALRCRLRMGAGGLEADSAGDTGSHILSSMLGADALAIIPSACKLVRAGERVELELLQARPWQP